MKMIEIIDKVFGTMQVGPYRLSSDGKLVIGSIYVPSAANQIMDLNRAYAIGVLVGRSEMEPPIGTDSDYQPICKFCNNKVDEMVTVHYKQGDQRMCVKCMHDKGHRVATFTTYHE